MDTILRLPLVALALVVSPCLTVALLRSGLSRRPAGPAAPTPWCICAAASVALNVAILLMLHLCGVRIATASLSLAHMALGASLLTAAGLRGCLRLPTPLAAGPVPLALAAAFALLVMPLTHLAGIDTYKWQDLATAVRVDGCVPWLVHPSSLLGFTPRSYPSAQPLLLATIQIVGGLGVDGGYYLMSLFSGLTGLSAALRLGRVLFPDRRTGALWLAFLYVSSPVFMRYNHWATGRGLLLAFLPLLLSILAERRGLRGAWRILPVAGVVALCHLAGTVAAVALPLLALLAPVVPAGRWARHVLLGTAAVAAALVAPSLWLPAPLGGFAGAARFAVTRFGFLVPLMAAGLLASENWRTQRAWRQFLPGLVVWFPFAFHSEMYAALLALPFVAVSATAGLLWLLDRSPVRAPAISAAAVGLGVAGAVVIVAIRSWQATPDTVRRAAAFLERHDPEGPYVVSGPGRARPQIQAYVSGCPRFSATAAPTESLPAWRLRPFPAAGGSAREYCTAWHGWIRALLKHPGGTDWYGKNPKHYYVVIDGHGDRPADAIVLYRDERVQVYGDAPRLQDERTEAPP